MFDLPSRVVNKFRPNRPRLGVPDDDRAIIEQKFGNHVPFVSRKSEPKIYGKMGSLEVRLAETKAEVKRGQRLRYKVFYEEMNAVPTKSSRLNRRDVDVYDPICDHLLVLDNGEASDKARRNWKPRPRVVGTYRLLRQDVAEHYGGFYTQGEYDIDSLIAAKSPSYKFVELGRSCVLESYRNKRTVELLWQGIWNYVREHKADVMIGCASFNGTDPKAHAMALSFLYHYSLAPEDWRVSAHSELKNEMNLMPKAEINARTAIKQLPPLIKGYLRLGAYIGDGAVIDHQFGTTDVLILLPVEAINDRYFAHFGAPGGDIDKSPVQSRLM